MSLVTWFNPLSITFWVYPDNRFPLHLLRLQGVFFISTTCYRSQAVLSRFITPRQQVDKNSGKNTSVSSQAVIAIVWHSYQNPKLNTNVAANYLRRNNTQLGYAKNSSHWVVSKNGWCCRWPNVAMSFCVCISIPATLYNALTSFHAYLFYSPLQPFYSPFFCAIITHFWRISTVHEIWMKSLISLLRSRRSEVFT